MTPKEELDKILSAWPQYFTDKDLDDHLFANIHLDSSILGSHLQGEYFARTTNFSQTVDRFILEKRDLCGLGEDEFRRIEAALKHSKEVYEDTRLIEKELETRMKAAESSTRTDSTWGASISALDSNYIRPVVDLCSKKFDEKGIVLIPGGWKGVDQAPGHAMAYQFRREPDGSITFLVFNTGSGISYHLRQGREKDKYFPVKAFRIPKEKVATDDRIHDKIRYFMYLLFKPKIYPGCNFVKTEPFENWAELRKYDAKRIYNEIFPELYALGAVEADPREFTVMTTQGQLGGTCAARVTYAIDHTNIQGEAFLKKLYFGKLLTIIDFYRLQKSKGNLDKPGVYRNLERAIRKLNETTRKLMQRTKKVTDISSIDATVKETSKEKRVPIFSQEQAGKFLTILKLLSQDIKNHRKPKVEAKVKEELIHLKPMDDKYTQDKKKTQEYLRFSRFGLSSEEQSMEKQARVGLEKKIAREFQKKLMPKREEFKDFAEFIKACYEVAEHNHRTGNPEIVIAEIEQLFGQFPLILGDLSKYIGDLPPDKVKEALNHLQAILRIYGRNCLYSNPYPLPQYIITSNIGLAAANVLSAQYFKKSTSAKLAGTGSLLLQKYLYSSDLTLFSANPYWDKKLAQFNNLLLAMNYSNQMQEKVDIDTEFLFHHLSPRCFEAIKKLAAGTSKDFETARKNLYLMMKGEIEVPDSEPLLKAEIEKAKRDYDLILQVKQLQDETALFQVADLNYFQNTDYSLSKEAQETDRLTRGSIPDVQKEELFMSGTSYSFSWGNAAPAKDIKTIQEFLDLKDTSPAKKIILQRFSDRFFSSKSSNEVIVSTIDYPDKALPITFPVRSLPYTKLLDHEGRILVTKNFFESNPDLLNDKDFQIMFLDNVFPPRESVTVPNLFEQLLLDNPMQAKTMITFIERGIRYHIQKDNVSDGGIFLLELAFHLERYLKNSAKHEFYQKMISELQTILKKAEDYIKIYRDRLALAKTNKAPIVKKLNDLLILQFIATVEDKPGDLTIDKLRNLFTCLLRKRLDPTRGDQNPYFYLEFSNALEAMKPILDQHFKKIDGKAQSELVRNILEEIFVPDLLPDKNFVFSLEYPKVTVKYKDESPYFVDLSRGSIESEKARLGYIPSTVYNDDYVRLFGKEPRIAEIQETSDTITCTFSNYQIIHSKVTKKNIIKLHHKDIWLTFSKEPDELALLAAGEHYSESDKVWWKTTSEEYFHNYYCTNLQGEFQLKVNVSKDKSLDSGADYVSGYGGYSSSSYGGYYSSYGAGYGLSRRESPQDENAIYQCQELDAAGVETDYTLLNRRSEDWKVNANDIYALFERIEDRNFIEVWQAAGIETAKIPLRIKLPRLGLEFEAVRTEEGSIEYRWIQDPRYRVVLDAENSLPDFENKIILERIIKLKEEKEVKETKERVALIPRQDFYATSDKDQEYFKYIYDVGATVPVKTISDKYKFMVMEWQQTRSQLFDIFPIKKDDADEDELTGISTEENLRIAYLYLGMRLPEKAMLALLKCKKGIKGTFAEVELLRKIMVGIPSQEGTGDLYQMTRVVDGETAAVRMLAAALLSRQKFSSFGTPAFETEAIKPDKFRNANEAYKFYEKKRLIDFYQSNFPAVCQNLTREYHSRLSIGIVPIDFQLSPEEELMVLRTGYGNEPPSRSITLESRWNALQIKLLIKEREELTKLQYKRALSTHEIARLGEIKNLIAEKNKSVGFSEHLTLIPEPVLPLNADEIENFVISRNMISRTDIVIIPPVYLLGSDKQRAFLKGFDLYYSLAIGLPLTSFKLYGFEVEAEKKYLKEYIERVLKSEFSTKREEQSNEQKAVFTACRLLLIALNYPKLPYPKDKPSFQDGATTRLIATKINQIYTSVLKNKPPITFQALEKAVAPISQKERKTSSDRMTETLDGITAEGKSDSESKAVSEKESLPASRQFRAQSSLEDPVIDLCKELGIKDLPKQLSDVVIQIEAMNFFADDEREAKELKAGLTKQIQEIEARIKALEKVAVPDKESKEKKETKELAEIERLRDEIQDLQIQIKEKVDNPFLKIRQQKFNLDLKRGAEINREKKERQELYRRTLDDKKKLSDLYQSLDETLKKDKSILELDLKTLLANANIALTGGQASLDTQAKIASGSLKSLKLNDLIGLYLQGDPLLFKQKTQLDEKSNAALYLEIHQYLLKTTANQHRTRTMKALMNLQKCPSDNPSHDNLLFEFGELLTQKRSYNPTEHPEILVFEHYENILVRKNQAEMIERLIEAKGEGYNSRIEQLIMGGGKSKVLKPLISLICANGNNISIIEEPASQFETGVEDLQAATERLFGKKGFPLIFDRETLERERDPEQALKNLQQLSFTLDNIVRVDRNYVITTSESIQSLQLKYLELLDRIALFQSAKETDALRKAQNVIEVDFEKKERKEAADGLKEQITQVEGRLSVSETEKRVLNLQKQALELEKILLLLQEKGDVLIDEVDTVLASNRELNYTYGNAESIAKGMLANIQSVYSLFDKVEIELPGGKTNLKEVMLGKILIPTEELWKTTFSKLTDLLVSDPLSPLYPITHNMSEPDKQELIQYLLNNRKEIPKSLFTFERTDADRSLIGLMKGEIELFKTCLKRKPNVDFGFPVDALIKFKEIAIPYLASNTPNPRADFGLIYEIINYTIQLQGIRNKLSLDVIQEFIKDFQNKATDEAAKSNGELDFEDTIAAKQFRELLPDELYRDKLPGLHLRLFNADNVSEMTALQDIITQNKKTYDYVLLNYILARIKQHPSIIRSNGINHVSQFRSARGMSGTPWNISCLHPNFQFDETLSFGTDGQTIDTLLQKAVQYKENFVHVILDKDPRTIIKKQIISHPKTDKIHALIDIGALFKDVVNNKTMAIILAEELSKRPNNKITHILYFDEENTLCALPFSKQKEKDSGHEVTIIGNRIRIGSSDPKMIATLLGGSTENYFTYYDQRHTTGTDIALTEDTIGIGTLDFDTKARDAWQGSMRLRRLAALQNIEILLPREVAELKKSPGPWTIQDVIKFVQKNQDDVLAQINLHAAFNKIDNIIRQNFLQKIYAAKTIEEKARLRKCFSEVFETKLDEDPFRKFGGCEKWEETSDILDDYINKACDKYSRLIQIANIEFNKEEFSKIFDELEVIKLKTIDNCSPGYKHLPSKGQDQLVETQKMTEAREANRDVQTDKEKETRKEVQTSSRAYPKPYKSWGGKLPKDLARRGIEGVTDLNAMLNASLAMPFKFSQDIYVTDNYKISTEGQTNFLDDKLKPIDFFMVIREPKSERLRALIITQEEMKEFSSYISQHRSELQKMGYGVWIKTPHDDLLTGTTMGLSHPDYPRILEQIQYFNADLNMLTRGKKFDWLLEEPERKLDFLKNKLLNNYPDKKRFLDQFEKAHALAVKAPPKPTLIIKPIINPADFFKAIESEDEKALAELITQFKQIESPREKSEILNLRDAGQSMMQKAILKRNPALVDQLLSLTEWHEDTDLKDSSLLLSINQFKQKETRNSRDIIRLLLSDPRALPPPNKFDEWEALIPEIMSCWNILVVEQFFMSLKEIVSDPIKLLASRMDKLLNQDERTITRELYSMQSVFDNKLKVWTMFIDKFIQEAPIEKIESLLNQWISDPLISELSDYFKGKSAPENGDILKSFLNDMRKLPLFLKSLKQGKIVIPPEKINSWIQLMDVYGYKTFEEVVTMLPKLLNETAIQNIFESEAGKALVTKSIEYSASLTILLKVYPPFHQKAAWDNILNKLFEKYNSGYAYSFTPQAIIDVASSLKTKPPEEFAALSAQFLKRAKATPHRTEELMEGLVIAGLPPFEPGNSESITLAEEMLAQAIAKNKTDLISKLRQAGVGQQTGMGPQTGAGQQAGVGQQVPAAEPKSPLLHAFEKDKSQVKEPEPQKSPEPPKPERKG